MVFFLLCALAMGAARYGTGIKLPVAIPLGLTVMFWGLLWRHGASEEAGAPMRRLIHATSLLIILTVPVVSLLSYNVDMGFGETWYRYTIAYYAGMALFALFTTRLRITHPVFVWLGAISYSVYLLGPVAQPIVEYMLPYRQLAPYPVHVTIVSAWALTVAMAYVSYRLIELPAQTLGRNSPHASTLRRRYHRRKIGPGIAALGGNAGCNQSQIRLPDASNRWKSFA